MKKKTPAKKRAAPRAKKVAPPIPLKEAAEIAKTRYEGKPIWKALPVNLQTERHFAYMITSLVKFSVTHPRTKNLVELNPSVSGGTWLSEDLNCLCWHNGPGVARTLSGLFVTHADLNFFFYIMEEATNRLQDGDLLWSVFAKASPEQRGALESVPRFSKIEGEYREPSLDEPLALERFFTERSGEGILPDVTAPPGFVYEWKRKDGAFGQPDQEYLDRLKADGWKYVLAGRHKIFDFLKPRQHVEYYGLVLMQMPRAKYEDSRMKWAKKAIDLMGTALLKVEPLKYDI
jgi:hypothetical protein